MQRFLINKTLFPELKDDELADFIKFMKHEFDAYLEDGNTLLAHNDGDAHWFTQQYINGKNGNGIYQDWFKNKDNHPVS